MSGGGGGGSNANNAEAEEELRRNKAKLEEMSKSWEQKLAESQKKDAEEIKRRE